MAVFEGSATVVAEAHGDRTDLELFEQEERTLANASPARLAEFRTARSCAREALRALGIPAGSIPVGADRAPMWPAGIVGSITHCSGYRAAAVARSGQLLALGVDAEPHAPLPHGVAEAMFTAEEVAATSGLRDDVHWGRVLFSAKEAVFKLRAQLGSPVPVVIRRVHPDGRIDTDPAGTGVSFDVRWAVDRRLVVTAARARPRSSPPL